MKLKLFLIATNLIVLTSILFSFEREHALRVAAEREVANTWSVYDVCLNNEAKRRENK